MSDLYYTRCSSHYGACGTVKSVDRGDVMYILHSCSSIAGPITLQSQWSVTMSDLYYSRYSSQYRAYNTVKPVDRGDVRYILHSP